jgi:hypothetical protein
MSKVFIILMLLFTAACNHSDSNVEEVEEEEFINYVIFCKHPLGHVMRHVVSSKSWRNSYGSRSGVYRFRDLEGIYHENSMGCYTNDKLRVNIEGKIKEVN